MIEAIFKETTKEKLLDKIGIKIPGLTTKEEAPKQEAPKQEEAPKDPLNELKDAVIEDIFEKLF